MALEKRAASVHLSPDAPPNAGGTEFVGQGSWLNLASCEFSTVKTG